ncbi:MAG TPA: response regulator [Candidatus Levybacteria bacterium]|nr:response regulator [Candidatus Levybacteria bacterium]
MADDKQYNLLLIEDEYDLCEIYKIQLTTHNIITDFALAGQEGLKKIQEKKYDVVLLDLMLPDMNGLEILKKIKSNDATKDIPVIINSNLSDQATVDEGLKLGAVSYIVKSSMTPDTLAAEVRKILDNN